MKKRIFAALLCVIMLFGMLPVTALAAEPKTIYVDAIGGNDKNNGFEDFPYATVEKAVTEAESGDTIQLGEGVLHTLRSMRPRQRLLEHIRNIPSGKI